MRSMRNDKNYKREPVEKHEHCSEGICEEEYKTYQKKHGLPSFVELDDAFEILAIEHDGRYMLRAIRKKIAEKLENALKLFDVVFQPETVMSDLHECRAFTEKDKEAFFTCYRELMMQYRQHSFLMIASTEAEEAAFIKEVWNVWKKSLPTLQQLAQKMRDSWLLTGDIKTELGYFG